MTHSRSMNLARMQPGRLCAILRYPCPLKPPLAGVSIRFTTVGDSGHTAISLIPQSMWAKHVISAPGLSSMRGPSNRPKIRICATFDCRWLVLAPVWIGLTEQILIDEYRPVWNAIRGFGNHDQGTTRRAQKRSQWDTLHPGRPRAASYQDLEGGVGAVLSAILSHREGQET